MDVQYGDKKVARLCERPKDAQRQFGRDVAGKLELRLRELVAAPHLGEITHKPPPRLHQLSGYDPPRFSVSVHRGIRIVFEPAIGHAIFDRQGSLDRTSVRAIVIRFVGDYHE